MHSSIHQAIAAVWCIESAKIVAAVARLMRDTGLAADEPEVHGLVALMELQASRTAARVDTSGRPVLLLERAAVLTRELPSGHG